MRPSVIWGIFFSFQRFRIEEIVVVVSVSHVSTEICGNGAGAGMAPAAVCDRITWGGPWTMAAMASSCSSLSTMLGRGSPSRIKPRAPVLVPVYSSLSLSCHSWHIRVRPVYDRVLTHYGFSLTRCQ